VASNEYAKSSAVALKNCNFPFDKESFEIQIGKQVVNAVLIFLKLKLELCVYFSRFNVSRWNQKFWNFNVVKLADILTGHT
jgi:hypothetical protein